MSRPISPADKVHGDEHKVQYQKAMRDLWHREAENPHHDEPLHLTHLRLKQEAKIETSE